jgi:uncharacterized protein (TIGR01777 family)
MALGVFDILYHHELTERLAWHPSQKRELRLHGMRNLIYAALFLVLGWSQPHGVLALAVLGLLAIEVVITLTDFVEEDRSRRLPASERVTHALLALNYGALLALLSPVLWGWARLPDALIPAYYGVASLLMAAASLGVLVFGLRDFAAAARLGRLTQAPAGGLTAVLPPRQTILITGATGFIGSRLVESLIAQGHRVLALTRDPQKAIRLGAPIRILTALDQIGDDETIDAVINLAGESLGAGLWTKARRKAVMNSRLEMTEAVVALIGRLQVKPAVLVNASAIGWYGLQDDERLTEESTGRDCFCRDVCVAWEAVARKAEQHVRVVRLRIGLVLGVEGGVLGRLLLPFEFGAGGPIGSGRQWMSWIARDDLVRLIAHVIATPSLSGAVNGTAPEPERNRAFGRALGHALHRPAFLPLPALPLRLLGGDFATELLLGGQRVLPDKALASGFCFRHPRLEDTLKEMVGA